jgi:hypothetical protein
MFETVVRGGGVLITPLGASAMCRAEAAKRFPQWYP